MNLEDKPLVHAILRARAAAWSAGKRPVALECGPDISTTDLMGYVLDLRVCPRPEAGCEVLAVPAGHIGRYEVPKITRYLVEIA